MTINFSKRLIYGITLVIMYVIKSTVMYFVHGTLNISVSHGSSMPMRIHVDVTTSTCCYHPETESTFIGYDLEVYCTLKYFLNVTVL